MSRYLISSGGSIRMLLGVRCRLRIRRLDLVESCFGGVRGEGWMGGIRDGYWIDARMGQEWNKMHGSLS
jgi:hypothetical protein